ncbi:PKD domain-containing protein [Rhizobacter sp. Root404]|uniref:PKD domain-containing protein n=1 Tax=Rhizobacter sp. Root404 TaxID=1736528 RepID=UPI00138ED87E|nr:PKD domain-containing protein [Rhizobacter sp. Root404]
MKRALSASPAAPMTRYVVRNVTLPPDSLQGLSAFVYQGYGRVINSNGDLAGAAPSSTYCNDTPFKYVMATESSVFLQYPTGGDPGACLYATNINDRGQIYGFSSSFYTQRFFVARPDMSTQILPDAVANAPFFNRNGTYSAGVYGAGDLFAVAYAVGGTGGAENVFGVALGSGFSLLLDIPNQSGQLSVTGPFGEDAFIGRGPVVPGGVEADWLRLGLDGSRVAIRSGADGFSPGKVGSDGNVVANRATFSSTNTGVTLQTVDLLLWHEGLPEIIIPAPSFSITPSSNERFRGVQTTVAQSSEQGGNYIIAKSQYSSGFGDNQGITTTSFFSRHLGAIDLIGALAMSSTVGISNAGVVVGTNASYAPVVWMPGQTALTPINDLLVSPPAGFNVNYIYGIGASGHIVAQSSAGLVILVPENLAGPPASAPVVGGIISSTDPSPVAAGSAVSLSASFTDANVADTHTAVFRWNDGTTSNATVVEAPINGRVEGKATASHSYAAAGIYSVSLEVSDGSHTTTVTRDIVVYDPTAGFVTGSGTILSPAGAYRADQQLAGPAEFALVSMYKKGAKVPTGETSFTFRAAGMTFTATAYDWLVVAGTKATYKGVGTLNGQPGFKFQLAATDNGKTGDALRMKIWHYDSGTQADVVDYDNQSGYSGAGQEGTVLLSGQVVVHK